MFLELLLVTFLIAVAIATVVALLFSRPINKLLGHLVSEELAPIWRRYIVFAVYVVGISGGVSVRAIEKYITPDKEGKLLVLNADRWILETYKSVIGTLQSVAWMLLIFFLFALVAYVVLRGFEFKRSANDPEK
ncbi:MAG: hypothetical protein GXO70_03240 [Acidobacteria bacterium]|nr:hypothetical protein [Acidobacteriota bacterium]